MRDVDPCPSGVDEREGRGPYLIAVYREGSWPHTTNQREVFTRRAAANLRRTQWEVDELIEEYCGSIDEHDDVLVDGGIVGPLPERVYIEVEVTAWETLRHLAGLHREYAVLANSASEEIAGPARDGILAAFNASQLSSSQAGEGR